MGHGVGVISGLMRPGDLVAIDQYAHASIVDGTILSRANTRFFRHNDAENLDRILSRSDGKKLVIVEGVYSMDGDFGPMEAICDLAEEFGALMEYRFASRIITPADLSTPAAGKAHVRFVQLSPDARAV